MLAYNNYFEDEELATVVTTASERRKRLKLKRIVISEHNYLALKKLGQAGDSFNDVISKLIRMHWNHQAKQQQQDKEEENDNRTDNGGVLFPRSIFELLDKDRQQLAEALSWRARNSKNKQTSKQESNNLKDAVKKSKVEELTKPNPQKDGSSGTT
jgi:hypothetical protein